jgi:hypothetical protein
LIAQSWLSVLPTIQLNHKALFWTTEIYNVRPDGVLSTKLQAADLSDA